MTEHLFRFDEIYQRESLFRSALAIYTKSLFFRNKARSASWDGKTLYDFAVHAPERIDELHKELVNHRFIFSPAKPVQIVKKEKKRVVYLWPWRERVVDLMLYQMLNRRLNSGFSPSVYAFRWHGRGVDQCQRHIQSYLRVNASRPLYLLKRDVADCFPSIPHKHLEKIIADLTPDGDYLRTLLLQHIKFNYYATDGEILTSERGVPFGAPTACLLANLALKPFDEMLDSLPDKCYARYADDMFFATPRRDIANEAKLRFDRIFTEIGISSKEASEINAFFSSQSNSDADFDYPELYNLKFLGICFKPGGKAGLSVDKQRKIFRLFRQRFNRFRRRLEELRTPEERARVLCRAAGRMLEQSHSQIAIIDYYLKHVNDTDQLKFIDRWLAEEVLARALKRGHRKGNFAKISFESLRKMGLPSLLHRRRLLLHAHLDSSFLQWKKA